MNDNDARDPSEPQRAPRIPIIGFVGEGGAVTITDAGWRPAPRPWTDDDDGRPQS